MIPTVSQGGHALPPIDVTGCDRKAVEITDGDVKADDIPFPANWPSTRRPTPDEWHAIQQARINENREGKVA